MGSIRQQLTQVARAQKPQCAGAKVGKGA